MKQFFNKKTIIPFTCLLFLFLIFPLIFVNAQDSYQINSNQTITIDKHGVCRITHNQTGSLSTFIPVKASDEWLQFRTHHPSHISLSPCFQCGENVTFTYKGSSITYGTVVSVNNTCWMDRNLGASRVATAYNDSAAYGDSFQWGRLDDRHQTRTSGITALEATSNKDVPGHSNFIITETDPYDWRIPQNSNLWQGVSGVNNPCPSGWRVPTVTEWETERLSWSSNDTAGAYASPLKLTAGGWRVYFTDGHSAVGANGYYWSSSATPNYGRYLLFFSTNATTGSGFRASGHSVRCIKN